MTLVPLTIHVECVKKKITLILQQSKTKDTITSEKKSEFIENKYHLQGIK